MLIRIKNWPKYQPRKDRTTLSWFCLSKDIVFDPKVMSLEETDRWRYIALLAWCCRLQTRALQTDFDINLDQLCSVLILPKKQAEKSIQNFATFQLIEIINRLPFDNQMTPNGCPTVHNKTVQNTIAQPAVSLKDFEPLYEKYPRKEGRSRGYEKFKKDILTQSDLDLLALAIENYSQLVKKEARDKKYIKQFSAFMFCWRDYLELSAEPVKKFSWPSKE
jgi:hypothetical protein